MTVKERAPADVVGAESERKHREITIRVYVYPRDGRWFAETTDLSLMTEGADEREALQCLLEQIAAYIRTTVGRGWEDSVLRPAPLRHRMALKLRVVWAKLRNQPASIGTKPVFI